MTGSIPPNGFQTAMKKAATGGYWELPTSTPNFSQKITEMARMYKPTIIFIQIQAENVLTPQASYDITKNSFTINFTGDVRQTVPSWMVSVGRNLSLTTFSNMVDVHTCRRLGIKSDYLEIGFDPLIYTKRPPSGKKYPIVAMFNNYVNQFPLSAYRSELVTALKSRFHDDFHVFGNNWGQLGSGSLNHSQLEESKIYNNSLIAINCSHFCYERYSSDRLLRILGSGTMCLSHKYPGMEQDYTAKEHLDVFESAGDLIHKCEYYLNTHEERQRIADNGYQLAHSTFTFEKMAENIINLYKKHNGRI